MKIRLAIIPIAEICKGLISKCAENFMQLPWAAVGKALHGYENLLTFKGLTVFCICLARFYFAGSGKSGAQRHPESGRETLLSLKLTMRCWESPGFRMCRRKDV
ncbi:hypothetical protein [Desulfonema ishimotonii]|uniref:hypothetical protein n=1 Tax=Desulfonema ishimotonii TaxID=45657 RepID=UPI000F55DE4B|nr:hypothetical protein [Desulfonema ishimotonii]